MGAGKSGYGGKIKREKKNERKKNSGQERYKPTSISKGIVRILPGKKSPAFL